MRMQTFPKSVTESAELDSSVVLCDLKEFLQLMKESHSHPGEVKNK